LAWGFAPDSELTPAQEVSFSDQRAVTHNETTWLKRAERRQVQIKTPNLSQTFALVVPAEFNFAAVFPAEDNPLLVNNDELTGNETRMVKFFLSDLAFAL
jgi:hypothetical protein